MAVEVIIKSKSLFKKKINFNDILKDDMRFGIIDESFRLDEGKVGEYTVIFNSKSICRGYEISFGKGIINLRMPLPTSKKDIEYFYEYVKYVCQKMGTNKFIRDNEEISFDVIPHCIELDVEASCNALNKMSNDLEDGTYSNLYTFGAVFPISLGKRELDRIQGDCEKFGELLNELQSMDVYYAGARVYQKDNGEYFCIYVLTEEVPTVLPFIPKLLMSDNSFKVDDWNIGFVIDGENKGFISYENFLDSISKDKLFDTEHFIIKLDSKKMEKLLEKYRVNL